MPPVIVEPGALRALTLWQPWASAIAYLGKNIENRSRRTSYTGPLLIHAGKRVDAAAMKQVSDDLPCPSGVVIAVARLTGCHRCDDGACSPNWAEPGRCHWRLDDVHRLPSPVPASGSQGLWIPDAPLRARVAQAVAATPAARRLLKGTSH